MEEETNESDSSTEDKPSGRNEFKIRSYDLEVNAESETAGIDELADICTRELQKIQRVALFGELEMLEEEDWYTLELR